MNQSEQIADLAAALAKAQGTMATAAKDSTNPFFNSKYADLASVWDACRGPLSDNGLSVIQAPAVIVHGEPEVYTYQKKGEERVGIKVATEVRITTRLLHASGQWIEDACAAVLPFGDPQSILAAITYLRRGALAAFVGVAPADDDGESITQARTPIVLAKKSEPPSALQVKERLFMHYLGECVKAGIYGENLLERTLDASDRRRELLRDLLGMPGDWMPKELTPDMFSEGATKLIQVLKAAQ